MSTRPDDGELRAKTALPTKSSKNAPAQSGPSSETDSSPTYRKSKKKQERRRRKTNVVLAASGERAPNRREAAGRTLDFWSSYPHSVSLPRRRRAALTQGTQDSYCDPRPLGRRRPSHVVIHVAFSRKVTQSCRTKKKTTRNRFWGGKRRGVRRKRRAGPSRADGRPHHFGPKTKAV